MSIHNLGAGDYNGKLVFQWKELDSSVKRISIQIATNGDFTQNYHHFLLPNLPGMAGASLALSAGPWFFRVGAWAVTNDDVEWSGIYGPIAVTTHRVMKPQEKAKLKILHTQALEGGLRIHTGMNTEYCVLVEYTTETSFTLPNMKYRFLKDSYKGHIDILGFNEAYTYNIRVAQIVEPVNTLVEPFEWIVSKGHRSLPPRRHLNTEDHTLHSAEKVLLRDARENKPMRFTSGSDYARWLAMQEKAKGALR